MTITFTQYVYNMGTMHLARENETTQFYQSMMYRDI